MSEKQEATFSRGTQGRETPSGWGTGRRPGGRTLKERGNVFAWRTHHFDSHFIGQADIDFKYVQKKNLGYY